MPPPGHEPFLRAICADHTDDTVRLAYADWLEENGDPVRAEFIRLQIIHTPDQGPRDARYDRLQELLVENRSAWLAELPAVEGLHWGIEFRRGFCDRVMLRTYNRWREHCERIVSASPVQFLSLSGAGEDIVRATLDVPEVGRLTTLALFETRIERGRLGIIAELEYLTNLQTLVVHRHTASTGAGEAMTDDDALAFVATPNLPKLEVIHLDGWLNKSAERRLLTRFKKVWCRNELRPR